jgi:segregation and condensation protein A
VTADFTVRLDRVFSGPMDLLLHLVREQEVEIHEIEITRILRAYLEHLKEITELDIEAAGDFVLMAATLMSIKSRSLLPKEELDLEEELDPRDELIQRLMEFRRFRGAADELEQRLLERGKLFERGWHGEIAATRPEPMLDLGDLTAWDLLGQWSRLQREIQANRPRQIAGDRRPLRFYVRSMAELLKGKRCATLREIVALDAEDGTTREGLIGSFCAVLELAKLGLVTVVQDDIRGDIAITLTATSALEIDEVLASATIDDETPEEQVEREAGAESALAAAGVEVPGAELPGAEGEADGEAQSEAMGALASDAADADASTPDGARGPDSDEPLADDARASDEARATDESLSADDAPTTPLSGGWFGTDESRG